MLRLRWLVATLADLGFRIWDLGFITRGLRICIQLEIVGAEPMYKLLLSWRYLRTRYIALASIISVTLGVGTLIVVNSVMAGFTREMHVRLHGILSDIIIESHSLDGLVDPAWHMQEIRKLVGDDLEGITQAVHVPAMLSMSVRGQMSTRQITL